MSRAITAIDIGSSYIKVLISVIDENGKAKVIGESTQPSYGIKKGEVTGIDEAINSIANALTGAERMAGITVSSAFVSINGKNIVSNNNRGVVAISDSEIIEEDAFRALEQARTIAIPQNREIIHLIPREFIVDQQNGIKNPIGMTGSRLEVDSHIISAPTTSIHNLERCIQSVGLKMEGPVFTGWAAAQSVLTETERELGVLLLDIGGGTTAISTFVEDAITYSTSIPFGGSNVTRDLAAGLRLSLDEAEKIKTSAHDLIKKSTENKGKEDTDILELDSIGFDEGKTISKKLFNEIVEARVDEIFGLVRENIEKAGQEYKLPAGIVITGGSAELPDITNIAQKVFGVPARTGHPKGLEGLADGISTPGYAALQGLVLHALDEDISYSNISSSGVSGGGASSGGIVQKVTSFFKNLMP